jgi:arylsulfatase A-like enzyme
MQKFIHRTALAAVAWIAIAAVLPAAAGQAAPPNVLLIFADDLGYGDLGCYGSETIRTPHIDRLAREGRKFTNFMVASSVCTPSRAALLTGCYPKRVGMQRHVLMPTSQAGLHPDERTIADHLRSLGYATACFGKWHLGHLPEVLPRAQGFDEYFGIPYSNDMNYPDNRGPRPDGPAGLDALWADPASTLTAWKTPLYENDELCELPADQRTITRRYTQRAIDFISAHRAGPFFVYLAHSMPHVPLYVPDEVRDPDPRQAYVNVIEHLDAEVGRLLDTLDELGLAETTYVIFTSDNGPWLSFRHHAGSAGPLRDGKMSTFEGGQRVPCLIRGPGIPAGSVCDGLTGTIDILPTLAALTESSLPDDRPIDGVDMSRLWRGEADTSPREEFLFYSAGGEIEGIRQGRWKLLVKQPPPDRDAPPDAARPEPRLLLFDLETDVGEQTNLASGSPALVTRLRERMTVLDGELTAHARPRWSR